MQEILESITWTVALGVGFSILQVLFSVRNNPINYLFGIAGILLTLWVMFQSKLYAELALNIYYLVMSIYGWWQWMWGKQKKPKPISYSSLQTDIKSTGIVLGSFLLSWYLLENYTDSDVAIFDALVASFAWAGMWLMAHRKIENWIFLNISNVLSIPLLIYKNLHLYAILSAVLFIAAIFGYINWRKIYHHESQQQSMPEST